MGRLYRRVVTDGERSGTNERVPSASLAELTRTGSAPSRMHVVVAFSLGDADLARLQAGAGEGVEVRTIRQPGPPPELVLCPPSSPQLIGLVRRQFPRAEVMVVELEDWLRSKHVEGPITRTLNAGASTYYVAPSTEALGGFLTELAAGRAVLGSAKTPARELDAGSGAVVDVSFHLVAQTGVVVPDRARRVVARYLEVGDARCPGIVEGLYLLGSLALGDFQPEVSDVDFVAVTTEALDDRCQEALAAVHAEVRAEADLPAFEGFYVTADELRDSPGRAGPGLFHHEARLRSGASMRTPVEWAMLARRGVAIRGLQPDALDVFDDRDELACWTLGNLQDYWARWVEQSGDHASRAAMAMLTDWGVAWGVLGVSRLLCTLDTGDIISKSDAGRYALDAFGERWHPIVTEALRCRPRPLALPESLDDAEPRRDEATAFMAHAIGTALGKVGAR
jgi:Domain of unknown function (DUF4111)